MDFSIPTAKEIEDSALKLTDNIPADNMVIELVGKYATGNLNKNVLFGIVIGMQIMFDRLSTAIKDLETQIEQIYTNNNIY